VISLGRCVGLAAFIVCSRYQSKAAQESLHLKVLVQAVEIYAHRR
jgi:hypothetical protein